MEWLALTFSDLFAWVILPLLIFSARVCDVSLGTLRIIFISRGIRFLAPPSDFSRCSSGCWPSGRFFST